MTDKPTPKEIDDLVYELRQAGKDDTYSLASAVLAKWGQPAQADEYPALVCDYCGALTPDPWHSSGMLHGKMVRHIHSCDGCRGAARAAQEGCAK